MSKTADWKQVKRVEWNAMQYRPQEIPQNESWVEEKNIKEKLRDIKDIIKWSNIGLGLLKWVKRYWKRWWRRIFQNS